MTNQLQKFTNEEFGSIRVIEIEGEPWFLGTDIAKALGYENTRDAFATLANRERLIYKGGQANTPDTISTNGSFATV